VGGVGIKAGPQLIAVDKSYQARGVGKALISEAKKWYDERSCKFLDVSTQSDNTQALDFYQRNGFAPVYSQITMHKWIDSSS